MVGGYKRYRIVSATTSRTSLRHTAQTLHHIYNRKSHFGSSPVSHRIFSIVFMQLGIIWQLITGVFPGFLPFHAGLMWLMASARMALPVGHNGSYSSKKVTESLNGDCVWAAHVPRNKAELNKIWQLFWFEIWKGCTNRKWRLLLFEVRQSCTKYGSVL